jgi:phosphoenolpyruvate carboxykinase (ATP)
MSIGNPGELRGLERHGLHNLNEIHWTLPTAALYEQALARREGLVTHGGPLCVRTGVQTGRAPNDRFIVREPSTEKDISWSDQNRPYDADQFDVLQRRMTSYLQSKDVFVQDGYAGADKRYRMPVRVVTEFASHSLFARNMFIQAPPEDLVDFRPEFTVLQAPRFHAVPEFDGTNSETFIILNFAKRLVLIGGSAYAGEIKKSIFSVLNFLLPFRDVLTMHCSANIGPDGDTALFFGLSGTGKTTLSADETRSLIGDDEHGWSDQGVFNFEGGCYAKMIRLSPEAEPEIFATTRRFGTLLENVSIDARTRKIDLDDDSLTENTRGSYHISAIPNAKLDGCGGHPRNIIFLTADAFGVLPPIARLTTAQAMYQFLSGYTAKVAGTERGVTEPSPVFSACYGAPFLPLHPARYAELLGERVEEHGARVWLVNTGWTGGPYGTGSRMPIGQTRAMIRAALAGALDDAPTDEHPVFGLAVPRSCPGVDSKLLDPRGTWADPEAYDRQAHKLAGRFAENFETFAEHATEEVRKAGPRT